MFLIKAGNIEINELNTLELKAKSQDFERAKQKANKLLKSFAQIEIIDSITDQCVHFQTRTARTVPAQREASKRTSYIGINRKWKKL